MIRLPNSPFNSLLDPSRASFMEFNSLPTGGSARVLNGDLEVSPTPPPPAVAHVEMEMEAAAETVVEVTALPVPPAESAG